MAFVCTSQLALAGKVRAPAAFTSRPRVASQQRPRRIARLDVNASTIWQLRPDPKWAQANEELSRKLGELVDLTSEIGTKKLCCLGTADEHAGDSDVVLDFHSGGIHVQFEAKGTSGQLDSDSQLFVKDIDSGCDVFVGDEKLDKGKNYPVRPGSVLKFGEHLQFQVQRNQFAHA